jgi:hypothetical protein
MCIISIIDAARSLSGRRHPFSAFKGFPRMGCGCKAEIRAQTPPLFSTEVPEAPEILDRLAVLLR